jgi:rhodanese-related sulfurtransferase
MGHAMVGIKEIDAAELSDWIENASDSFSLIDVRGAAEMAQGVLPAAETMPMHLIPLRIAELRKRGKIVFYCHSGARSGQVCAFLQQHGISQVFNLRGGIVDWFRRGLPLEAPPLSSMA